MPLMSDEVDYHTLAVNLSAHFHYVIDSVPTAYRPVGYPVFLSLVYAIVGPNPIAAKVIQAILDSAIVVLLPRLLPLTSDKIKIRVAIAWALFPPAILYPNLLMTESVYTVFLVSAATLYTSVNKGRTNDLLVGALLGVLTLMRPASVMLFIGLAAIDLAVNKLPRRVVLISIALVIVVTPWIVRNWIVMGEPLLTTSSGINLLIGNNPNTNGSYSSNFAPAGFEMVSNESVKDRMAFHSALSYIAARPDKFIVNGFKKFAHFFSSEFYLLISQFGRTSLLGDGKVAEKYASVSLIPVFVVNLGYAIVLLVGWIGFLASPKNTLWYFFAALLSTLLLVHFVTFGGNRFHFPLMPFFAVFAVWVLEGERRLANVSRGKKIAMTIGILSCLCIWGTECIIVLSS